MELPVEIIFQIINEIEEYDLPKVAKINKYYNEICQDKQ